MRVIGRQIRPPFRLIAPAEYNPFIVNGLDKDPAEIVRLIAELREEHRDLDEAITRLSDDPAIDQLQLRRMKKRKLKLKDWIAFLQSQLIPDIDA